MKKSLPTLLLFILSHSCFADTIPTVTGLYGISSPDNDQYKVSQLQQQQQRALAAAEAARAAEAAQREAHAKQQECNRQRGFIASEKASCESRASAAQTKAGKACPPDVTVTIGVPNGVIDGSWNPRTKCMDDARMDYTDAMAICLEDFQTNKQLLPTYCQ